MKTKDANGKKDSADNELTGEQPPINTGVPIHLGRTFLLTVILLSIFAVEPALAQTSSICQSKELIKMIEGFFQLTTGLGAIALPVVWQADYLIEIFTLTQQQQQALRRHRRKSLKSAVILFVLGPIYTIAGPMLGLPLAQCGIDLIPL